MKEKILNFFLRGLRVLRGETFGERPAYKYAAASPRWPTIIIKYM